MTGVRPLSWPGRTWRFASRGSAGLVGAAVVDQVLRVTGSRVGIRLLEPVVAAVVGEHGVRALGRIRRRPVLGGAVRRDDDVVPKQRLQLRVSPLLGGDVAGLD